MAIARRMLVAIYYILRDGVPYRELRASSAASSDVRRRMERLVAQLQLCGQDVELKPLPATISTTRGLEGGIFGEGIDPAAWHGRRADHAILPAWIPGPERSSLR